MGDNKKMEEVVKKCASGKANLGEMPGGVVTLSHFYFTRATRKLDQEKTAFIQWMSTPQMLVFACACSFLCNIM